MDRRLLERPELRATAKVVGILEPSRRRGAVVGVLKEEPGGGALLLIPCDPRLPRCLIRSSELPNELKSTLKACLPTPYSTVVPVVQTSALSFLCVPTTSCTQSFTSLCSAKGCCMHLLSFLCVPKSSRTRSSTSLRSAEGCCMHFLNQYAASILEGTAALRMSRQE